MNTDLANKLRILKLLPELAQLLDEEEKLLFQIRAEADEIRDALGRMQEYLVFGLIAHSQSMAQRTNEIRVKYRRIMKEIMEIDPTVNFTIPDLIFRPLDELQNCLKCANFIKEKRKELINNGVTDTIVQNLTIMPLACEFLDSIKDGEA